METLYHAVFCVRKASNVVGTIIGNGDVDLTVSDDVFASDEVLSLHIRPAANGNRAHSKSTDVV